MTGMTWDPDSYLAFADLRSRPGLELLARINHPNPETIVDLGCGPGHLTAVVARRWPEARVIGIDDSAEMLGRAESQFPAHQWPTITWQHEDIANWAPHYPVSVLYSNATLHWLGNHRALFPRLLAMTSPGGVLAVQMPDNWDQPSHRLISRLVDDPRWKTRTAPVFLGHPVAEPAEYRMWLQPAAGDLDLWRTTYHHILDGDDAVLGWVKGSVLRPILAVLEPDESEAFLAQLAVDYRAAYPPEADGTTVFPFSRFFLVATRTLDPVP
jgi:trans-aconitate 2-methyltransferase